MKVVAGRVEREGFVWLVWLPDSESDDAATPDKQGQWECSGATEGVEKLQSWASKVERGARWTRIDWVGGLGRMGWPVSC